MGFKQELGPHCEHLEINILFNCRTPFHAHVSQSPSKCYLTPCSGSQEDCLALPSKKVPEVKGWLLFDANTM